MTDSRSRPTVALGLAVGLAASLILACSPAPPTPTPSAAGPSSASNAPSPEASASTGPPPAGQTDTDWGRIWDAVPVAFPVFPGATTADEAASDVVSATFVLEGADTRAIATWMQTELERAAYATDALNGPFEDGSFVLDSTGAAGCRVQVVVAPLGGLTTLSVRYGAACPGP